MNDKDKTYLLKELTRTIDESDSTAAFCLCQRWILKDALALLKEQERTVSGRQKEREDKIIEIIAEWLVKRYEPPKPVNFWFTSEKAIENTCKKMWVAQLNELIKKEC